MNEELKKLLLFIGFKNELNRYLIIYNDVLYRIYYNHTTDKYMYVIDTDKKHISGIYTPLTITTKDYNDIIERLNTTFKSVIRQKKIEHICMNK